MYCMDIHVAFSGGCWICFACVCREDAALIALTGKGRFAPG